MKSKIVLFVFIALLATASVFKGEILSNLSIGFSNYATNSYDNFAKSVKDYINEYFRQASEIEKLRAQNEELERSATLLSTFANELNQILKDKGKVSKKQAIEKAEKEYDIFNKTQKIESDFDKQIENLKRGKK